MIPTNPKIVKKF